LLSTPPRFLAASVFSFLCQVAYAAPATVESLLEERRQDKIIEEHRSDINRRSCAPLGNLCRRRRATACLCGPRHVTRTLPHPDASTPVAITPPYHLALRYAVRCLCEGYRLFRCKAPLPADDPSSLGREQAPSSSSSAIHRTVFGVSYPSSLSRPRASRTKLRYAHCRRSFAVATGTCSTRLLMTAFFCWRL
jgi:hypothetical protein